jgi:NagD protein
MIRAAIERLGVESRDIVIVGDRMDTDILLGIQSEIDTVLCLSGVTAISDLPQWAFRPHCIVKSVSDIPSHHDFESGDSDSISSA